VDNYYAIQPEQVIPAEEKHDGETKPAAAASAREGDTDE